VVFFTFSDKDYIPPMPKVVILTLPNGPYYLLRNCSTAEYRL